ncbi:cytochrome P450 81Q32-like [Rutidosis leptorrhynchoides]|uniref:cytochrome P450 81Q32-like n=1 Tax=Rutidosis leptorrhynchoides TaxID=125765 RepID=UPI003A9A3364
MEFLSLCISFIVILVSYLLATRFHHKFSNLPPTIFPTIPIIGHLYLLKHPLYRTLAKISAKRGPIVLLHFGTRRVLLIASPSASEKCFTKNNIIFANRPRMLVGKIIANNYTSLGSSSNGDNWRNLRRIALIEILSIHRLNEFHDIREEEGRLLIRKLLLLDHSSHVDVKSALYELTLNVMMRMISGNRYFGGDVNLEVDEQGKRFTQILNELFLLAGAANLGDYMPILRWFGVNGLEKKLIALNEKKDEFFQGLIDYLKRKPKVVNKKKTLIEDLLSLQESDPNYYTDEMIRNFFMNLVAAGIDTSAGTMEWALSLLLNNPQVLKKAQNEIDGYINKDRLIEESDIVNLPYLRCIINETLRLYPPGPLLVPHESSKDCIIGGYNITSGTMLLVNQWAIYHDPKLWTDPEKFNPERFEGCEGTRDGFKLMPFGSGRRSCPGEGLAVRVIGSTLGLLIQCFDWERLSDEMVDMTEGPGLTMPKTEPLVAKCKPRLEMQNLLSKLLVD